MPPAIPDRWLNYKPVGERVEGTRFIAFKVPLRECVNASVDEENRLDGQILLHTIPNLGMIIDLTNTTRYYNPKFFKEKGIEYSKLMIPGHKTPHRRLVKQFKNMVIRFLKKNPENDKLIGVHCTHGVNRTGYLICNYMISELDIQPTEAIANFAAARGHEIERQNYLESLNSLRSVSDKLDQSPDGLLTDYVPHDHSRYTSLHAHPAPVLSPTPVTFDRRNRFERFRQEANEPRKCYRYAGAAAQSPPPLPVQQRSKADRYNRKSTNSSNYNSRYVNTTRSYSRSGGNSYPTPRSNHHHQLTHLSGIYDSHVGDDQPYANVMRRRRNGRESNNGSMSGARNYNRFQADRHI